MRVVFSGVCWRLGIIEFVICSWLFNYVSFFKSPSATNSPYLLHNFTITF